MFCKPTHDWWSQEQALKSPEDPKRLVPLNIVSYREFRELAKARAPRIANVSDRHGYWVAGSPYWAAAVATRDDEGVRLWTVVTSKLYEREQLAPGLAWYGLNDILQAKNLFYQVRNRRHPLEMTLEDEEQHCEAWKEAELIQLPVNIPDVPALKALWTPK